MNQQQNHDGASDAYLIVVNGTEHVVASKIVSYEAVSSLAFPVPPAPDVLYSVTFRKAQHAKDGSLAAGATVEVKKRGTIFNVTPTGKS